MAGITVVDTRTNSECSLTTIPLSIYLLKSEVAISQIAR